jgi:hypothetical protein
MVVIDISAQGRQIQLEKYATARVCLCRVWPEPRMEVQGRQRCEKHRAGAGGIRNHCLWIGSAHRECSDKVSGSQARDVAQQDRSWAGSHDLLYVFDPLPDSWVQAASSVGDDNATQIAYEPCQEVIGGDDDQVSRRDTGGSSGNGVQSEGMRQISPCNPGWWM